MDNNSLEQPKPVPNFNRGGFIEIIVVTWVFTLPALGINAAPLSSYIRHAGIIIGSLSQVVLLLFLIGSYTQLETYFRVKPKIGDLFTALGIAFICLSIAVVLALIMNRFGYKIKLEPGTSDIPPFLFIPLLVISVISIGLREELFFRVWLITMLKNNKVPDTAAVLISLALFTFGHYYQGIVGLASSAALGLVLSLFWLRTRSFWAIALGHALYNFVAFFGLIKFE